ncbi:MAG: hypothetical protein P8I51_10470, partial [Polaribacter sp.]|nr:hypothetical protein [Polaribacter sp.]
DSVHLKMGMSPITELSKGLKLHYENKGKDFFYASSNRFAHVLLVLEKHEKSERTKTILLNLVKTFNETEIKKKDSISFNIVLDYPINKPPPPPPILN